MDVFPGRLAAARRQAGMSGAQLCARVGLRSRSVVTKWEQGKGMPDTPIMPLLAVALGTTVDHLLGVDLLREVEPPRPVDLAVAASGDGPLAWSGRPLTGVDRRRAFAVLHGLLAPADQLREISDYPQGVHREPGNRGANHARNRAQLLSDAPVERPHTKGRTQGGGGGTMGGSDQ